MELFFAKDSSQKPNRADMGVVISFGGIFVAENQLKPLRAAIDEICRQSGIPDPDGVELWKREKFASRAPVHALRSRLQGATTSLPLTRPVILDVRQRFP